MKRFMKYGILFVCMIFLAAACGGESVNVVNDNSSGGGINPPPPQTSELHQLKFDLDNTTHTVTLAIQYATDGNQVIGLASFNGTTVESTGNIAISILNSNSLGWHVAGGTGKQIPFVFPVTVFHGLPGTDHDVLPSLLLKDGKTERFLDITKIKIIPGIGVDVTVDVTNGVIRYNLL